MGPRVPYADLSIPRGRPPQNVEEAFRRAARDIHAKFRESSHDTSRAGLTSSGSSRPGVIAASLEGRDQSSRGDGRCCVIS